MIVWLILALSAGVALGWAAASYQVRHRETLRRETKFALSDAVDLDPVAGFRRAEGQ